MNKRPIRILSNLARTGGTLISKCIGSMDGIVLLSEIHPLDSKFHDPRIQAQSWYGLLHPDEILDRQLDFIDTIQLIEQRCTEQGKTLLIRDWAHLDFIGVPFIARPACKLLLTDALKQAFSIIQCALVRHPVDLWLSTARLAIMQGKLELEPFLSGYRRFAEESVRTGFIRYEDFTREPETEMRKLCERLALDFDSRFTDRWPNNHHVTGDMSGTSRGSGLREIRPLPEQQIEQSLLRRFRENRDYQQAIALLGYTDPQ
ncbi:MAG: hypothetical protein IMY76_08980 [Chloroflexi bacterium]|nr:hypothetical protein [Chloroflexota bacterium]